MKNNYSIINISGWLIFFISLGVYSLTLEPTASFWDCSELIASAYKLQVPHPPGAPLYLLIGRLFSLLAFGGVEKIAVWINWLSALSSAFTILFLYWTIILIIKKVVPIDSGEKSRLKDFKILGAAAIGSLSFAFSDTFWFSAVEAEVYALSSFLFILSLWMIMKWEKIEDPQKENQWMILIAYVVGLSAGVHLLNLLVIPAFTVIIYLKKWRPNTSCLSGIVIALVVGVLVLMLVLKGVYEGIPVSITFLELFFVNALGFGFGSGFVIFLFGLICFFSCGIFYSIKYKKEVYNTVLLSLLYLVIGYSSYMIIYIRANYHPPINEGNPDTILGMVSYIQREQYGENPVLFGPFHAAKIVDHIKGEAVYIKGKDRYEISHYKSINVYDANSSGILPRMWSQDPAHKEIYAQVSGLAAGNTPHLKENLLFFLKYQINHMYLRYFMWNFSGREGDLQGSGYLLPNDLWKNIPESFHSKARNNFLMLPFLLGLAGIIFNFRKNRKYFSFLLSLFLLTGICLAFYLNTPPNEPRERDYIYFGSFLIYSIWIGLGAISVFSMWEKFFKKPQVAFYLGFTMCSSVPLIMFAEGWDDHDRSNRYVTIDDAKNKLASCAPGSVLFTSGDNDTFPLWYAQEVEGYRKDVRVVVLSYLNADWYIDQLKQKTEKGPALVFSLSGNNYKTGGLNDHLPYVKNANLKNDEISLNAYLNLVRSNFSAIQVHNSFRSSNTLPAKSFYLETGIASTLNKKIPESLKDFVVAKMNIVVKGQNLEKKELMILDYIQTNNWGAAIYFSKSAVKTLKVDLEPYLVQEGLTYRLLPIENPDISRDLINTDVLYDNLVNRFVYTNTANKEVYYSSEEHVSRTLSQYRKHFNTLAEELIFLGNEAKAREVLLKNLSLIPDQTAPYDYHTLNTIRLLYEIGEEDLALEIALKMAKRSEENLKYLQVEPATNFKQRKNLDLYVLKEISAFMKSSGNNKNSEILTQVLVKHLR